MLTHCSAQLTLPEGAELTDGDTADLAYRLMSNIGHFLGLRDGLECDVKVGTYLLHSLMNLLFFETYRHILRIQPSLFSSAMMSCTFIVLFN